MITTHLNKEDSAKEEALEKENRKLVSIGSKLFHLIGEYYLRNLVGQEAGASSCQEGLGACGRVTN